MPTGQPNVLFLLSDQHSYRFLSYLDDTVGEPVSTPNIDRFFECGTVFEQTYCQFPICTPSRLSLLTGRNPQRCHAWGNGHMLHDECDTIADVFSAAGYQTFHVGKMHFEGDNQFAGFDHRPYGDVASGMGHQMDPPTPYWEKDWKGLGKEPGQTGIPESMLQEQNVATETVTHLREHQARSPDQPWFLMASFSRPHGPMTAPRRFLDRYWPDDVPEPKVGRDGDGATHPFMSVAGDELPETDAALRKWRAGYFACVEYLDEIIGDLRSRLERTGLLENTVIVYTSDHGEMAGEHGIRGKLMWHEASSRVPMVVQTPDQYDGTQPGRSVETPVGLVDLYPTLCELCDIAVPSSLDGVELAASVTDGIEPDRGPVISDNLSPYNWGEQTEFRMVRDGRWKFVHHRNYPDALFDMEEDPNEQNDLLPDSCGAAKDAHSRLSKFVQQTIDWDEIEKQRQQDKEVVHNRNLGIVRGSNNQYHLPDGRIVDADAPLYRSNAVAEAPAQLIRDCPDNPE
jgi:choline-sulfatase